MRRAVGGLYLPLALLLVAGVGLRLLLMLAYRPAVLSNADSGRFLHFAHSSAGPGLFGDAFGPSGYAAFLRATRALSPDLDVTIALQHALGVATALLLYLAVRRLDAPHWAACIAAAVVLLSGHQIYVEHALLSEAPFTLLAATALYAAVRGLDDPRPQLWAALAGAVAAGALLFRNVGAVLLAIVVVWLALALRGGLRAKAAGAGAALAAIVAVLGAYGGLAAAQDGVTGLTSLTGWNAYGRSAPFADCSRFRPPSGTAFLCEQTPPGERSGTLFYLWRDGSPARTRFGSPPNGNRTLGRFGRAAILNQPLDYLKTVARELPRFVDPDAHPVRLSGAGDFRVGARLPDVERSVLGRLNEHYGPTELRVRAGAKVLDRLRGWDRGGGVVPVALLALTLAGIVAGPRRVRLGAVLFGAAGVGLVVMPAATLLYIPRYGLPATALLGAGAALGAGALGARLKPSALGRPERAAPARAGIS